MPHSSMAMANPTITSIPVPVPEINKQQQPSTQNLNSPHLCTTLPPWPPMLPALFPKPAQKVKPYILTKLAKAKPSVICGCPGMLHTKDHLRPP